MKKIPLSILDLVVVKQGGNAQSAISETVRFAQHAEELGFERFWMSEHHNMANIASAATSVLIGHVAGHTDKIRVGSGGIMLPNHSPLVIAEQFGTLETLYPKRIDLGLGRAPGTDQQTAMALRRNAQDVSMAFPSDVKQLQTYFSTENSTAAVRAFPAEGLDIPLWILGSSTDSAYLAAQMGLPYAFAAHFAPAQFRPAIAIYRNNFKPSKQLAKPYVMACVNVIGGETNEEAQINATSLVRMFTGIVTNARSPLQPAGDLPDSYKIPEVRAMVENMLACTFIGDKETLRDNLGGFIDDTKIDELMVTTYLYDEVAKFKSLDILRAALE
ncbi:LLM class flavin-dependent oxidoreductase [Flavobacterium sp. SM2513]|uniref:LLM class flavin-dependent oxidoreductase n=1 Tax=Flavobacterium sp. SM2513 TaxID=3424766 RepID=UPI003D7F6E32